MQLPIIIFLIIYLVYVLIFLLFAFFNLFLMLKYSFSSFGAYLVTYGFIAVTILVLAVTGLFVLNVDWTQTITLGIKATL